MSAIRTNTLIPEDGNTIDIINDASLIIESDSPFTASHGMFWKQEGSNYTWGIAKSAADPGDLVISGGDSGSIGGLTSRLTLDNAASKMVVGASTGSSISTMLELRNDSATDNSGSKITFTNNLTPDTFAEIVLTNLANGTGDGELKFSVRESGSVVDYLSLNAASAHAKFDRKVVVDVDVATALLVRKNGGGATVLQVDTSGTGVVSMPSGIASTAPTNGSLVVTGGIGISNTSTFGEKLTITTGTSGNTEALSILGTQTADSETRSVLIQTDIDHSSATASRNALFFKMQNNGWVARDGSNGNGRLMNLGGLSVTGGGGSGTITGLSTLYIADAPDITGYTGSVTKGPFALLVDAGTSRFEGGMELATESDDLVTVGSRYAIASSAHLDTISSVAIQPTFTNSAGFGVGILMAPRVTGDANDNAYGVWIEPELDNGGASGSTGDLFTSLRVVPAISDGSGWAEAATIYANGAPSVGDVNYGLVVHTGNNRFGGSLNIGGGAGVVPTNTLDVDGTVSFSGQMVLGASSTLIYVTTLAELTAAIGSNRKIIIAPGTYDVAGTSIDLGGLSNLVIVGSGTSTILVSTTPTIEFFGSTSGTMTNIAIRDVFFQTTSANSFSAIGNSINDMAFEGCYFTTTTSGTGIVFDGGAIRNILISNCHFINCVGTGISITDGDEVVISNCVFKDSPLTSVVGGSAMDLIDCENTHIIGNNIDFDQQYGIRLRFVSNGTSSNHVVSGNFITLANTVGNFGITVQGSVTLSEKVVISGNVIRDLTTGSGNDIGIYLLNCSHISVTGNSVTNCEYGIDFSSNVLYSSCTGNIVQDCGVVGIFTSTGSDYNNFTGNTLENNGPSPFGTHIIVDGVGHTHSIIKDNIARVSVTDPSSIDPGNSNSIITTGGGNITTTLADADAISPLSFIGHRHRIEVETHGGGDLTLRVASFVGGGNLSGGVFDEVVNADILFDAAGEYVVLEWMGSVWALIESNGPLIISDYSVSLVGDGDVTLNIIADKVDGGGEDNNPKLHFEQDAGATGMDIGIDLNDVGFIDSTGATDVFDIRFDGTDVATFLTGNAASTSTTTGTLLVKGGLSVDSASSYFGTSDVALTGVVQVNGSIGLAGDNSIFERSAIDSVNSRILGTLSSNGNVYVGRHTSGGTGFIYSGDDLAPSALILRAGNSGTSTAAGIVGAAVTMTSGSGGDGAAGAFDGGDGGDIGINGQVGGATGGVNNDGGRGSGLFLSGGDGGAGGVTAGTGGAGGSITLTPGNGSATGNTAGANGQVIIGLGGTAALPAITFTGSTDTGIYNAVTNELSFTTNGVQRMDIDGNGHVGFSTTADDSIGLRTSFDNSSAGSQIISVQLGTGELTQTGSPATAVLASTMIGNASLAAGEDHNVVSTMANGVSAKLYLRNHDVVAISGTPNLDSVATLYIEGAPTLTSGVTSTAGANALHVAAGTSLFDGIVRLPAGNYLSLGDDVAPGNVIHIEDDGTAASVLDAAAIAANDFPNVSIKINNTSALVNSGSALIFEHRTDEQSAIGSALDSSGNTSIRFFNENTNVLSERMRLDSVGLRVGSGTGAATNTLDVDGTANISGDVTLGGLTNGVVFFDESAATWTQTSTGTASIFTVDRSDGQSISLITGTSFGYIRSSAQLQIEPFYASEESMAVFHQNGLRIDPSNIAVTMTTPTDALEVVGSANISADLTVGGATNGTMVFDESATLLTIDSVTGDASLDLKTDGTQDMRILSGATIGAIVTTANLQIHTSSALGGLTSGVASFSSSGLHLVAPTSGVIGTASNTLDVDGTANISGDVTFGGELLAANGVVGAPAYSFTTSTGTGMWSSTTNTLNFSTDGSERIEINATGEIGIGTGASDRFGLFLSHSVSTGDINQVATAIIGGNVTNTTNSGEMATLAVGTSSSQLLSTGTSITSSYACRIFSTVFDATATGAGSTITDLAGILIDRPPDIVATGGGTPTVTNWAGLMVNYSAPGGSATNGPYAVYIKGGELRSDGDLGTDEDFTATWTGFSSAPTSSIRLRLCGKTVFFEMEVTGGTVAANQLFTSDAMPANVRPNKTTYFPCIVSDNGTDQGGVLKVLTTGVISVGASVGTTVDNFTTSGSNRQLHGISGSWMTS